MKPFASVKAIALDMDQTIIDFAGSRAAALEAVVDRVAASGHPVDAQSFLARHRAITEAEDSAYVSRGTWTPTVERLRNLCKEFGWPSDGFAQELADLYTESRYANLRQYPETRASLELLMMRFPLFLVTNGPSAHQHREIDVTGVARFFKRTFVCEDLGLRKPDPRMFEAVRAAAGVEPAAMMMVGDFWKADIDAPRRLGWRTAWVVRDPVQRAAADRSRADAVVRSVADLPPLLGIP